jgi:hypothetical protein
MTDPVVLWLSGFCTGVAASGCLLSRTRQDRGPDWRRSFTHENTKRPSGPPPLKLRRSDTAASTRPGPTTQKPNIIPRGQSLGVYQPRPQQGTPNPPPSEP